MSYNKGGFIHCSKCGKECYVRYSRLQYKTNFCSRECYTEYLKTKAHSSICVVCGKEYKCQPCQHVLRNRKTCSVACRAYLQTVTPMKENYICTENRRARYKKVQEDWRKDIFSRDNYTCQICGEKGGYIQAHHISTFQYDKMNRTITRTNLCIIKKVEKVLKISGGRSKLFPV